MCKETFVQRIGRLAREYRWGTRKKKDRLRGGSQEDQEDQLADVIPISKYARD